MYKVKNIVWFYFNFVTSGYYPESMLYLTRLITLLRILLIMDYFASVLSYIMLIENWYYFCQVHVVYDVWKIILEMYKNVLTIEGRCPKLIFCRRSWLSLSDIRFLLYNIWYVQIVSFSAPSACIYWKLYIMSKNPRQTVSNVLSGLRHWKHFTCKAKCIKITFILFVTFIKVFSVSVFLIISCISNFNVTL